MIGPVTNSRVEVGINSKSLTANDRLVGLPPGGMCNFKVKVTDPGEVDEQLISWVKQAYDTSG
jgi:hypothetical protein